MAAGVDDTTDGSPFGVHPVFTALAGVQAELVETARSGLVRCDTTLSPAATLAAVCEAGIIPMIFAGPGSPTRGGRPPEIPPAGSSPPPNAAPQRALRSG